MRLWPGHGAGLPRVAALVGLFYLYVWLRIEPHLVFHVQEPVFFLGRGFLDRFLVIPGGLSEYAAAFLGQSYAFDLLGAAVVTAVAMGIALCTGSYVHAVTGRRRFFATFVPAMLLLVLHNRYRYELACDLSLLLAIGAAAAYARAEVSTARRALGVAAAPLVYWLGGGAFLVYALLAAVAEAHRRRPALVAGWVALGAGLPWVAARTVYPGMLADAYLHLLPWDGAYLLGDPRFRWAAVALYLVPAAATLPALRLRWLPALAAPRRRGLSLALPVLGAALVWTTKNPNHSRLLEIDYRAQRQEWPQVLAEARQLTAYDVLTVYNVQRALCYEGLMGDDLLSYPHLVDAPVFVPTPEAPSRLLATADNLLETGYVNKAEHMLQEALEILGDRPSILRRLVTVNVLKDRPGAARVYLGLLRKSPLDRAWSEAYLAALEADPRRDDDAAIRRRRRLLMIDDYPGFFTAEDILHQLLARNPRNPLAFDLLMANYVQTAQVDRLVANLPRLADFPKRFSGDWIPRLYEEAWLLWATQVRLRTGRVPPLPVRGRRVSAATRRRYVAFSQVLAAHRDDRSAARRALVGDFHDTFWYYYLFRDADRDADIVTRASLPMP